MVPSNNRPFRRSQAEKLDKISVSCEREKGAEGEDGNDGVDWEFRGVGSTCLLLRRGSRALGAG